MDLSTLASPLQDKKILGDPHRDILGLAYDSREVQSGFLFAALRGTHQDGHDFIPKALERGANGLLLETPISDPGISQIVVPNSRQALAVLSDQFYHHPTQALKVVGITGTNGKTTTTYLCESIFAAAGFQTGVIGTIQNKIGSKTYECKNTTPESLDLFKLFAQMVDEKVGACAMEVSSHALDQGRIRQILFDAVVFTNLTQDHLDYHKTMEAYFEAKARLFKELSTNKKPKAVINADDPYGRELIKQIQLETVTYGIDHGEIRAHDVQVDWKGVSYLVDTPEGKIQITASLSGRFNVYNSLAALATGFSMGIPLKTIQQGLKNASYVRGRFEQIYRGQQFAVIIDYAHTPDGLLNLLNSARHLTQGRLIVVFGCGGDRDRGKRPIMGEIASRIGDVVIITSDNPRSEDPLAIIEEIKKGVTGDYQVEPDRRKAIELGLSMATPGDCVVIAGKGHETYQIFKDKTIHFDDREVAEGILATLSL